MTKSIEKAKIKFSIKIGMFIMSVLALSGFFEAFRQIQAHFGLYTIGFMVVAILFNIIMLFSQAWLIYYEEKVRGNLKKRVDVFERLINYLESKQVLHSEGKNIES